MHTSWSTFYNDNQQALASKLLSIPLQIGPGNKLRTCGVEGMWVPHYTTMLTAEFYQIIKHNDLYYNRASVFVVYSAQMALGFCHISTFSLRIFFLYDNVLLLF